MKLTIGNVTLDNNVILAPMAGVTDLPYRVLCREQGCGLVCMEMVSAKAVLYKNRNTKELLEVDPRERPVSLQLFGSDPEILLPRSRRRAGRGALRYFRRRRGLPVPECVKKWRGLGVNEEPEAGGGDPFRHGAHP